MPRFVVTPVSGSGSMLSRFMMNTDNVTGLVETHDGQTLIRFVNAESPEGSKGQLIHIKETFDHIRAKMKMGYKQHVAVHPYDSQYARVLIDIEKVVGLAETVRGEVVMTIKVSDFSTPAIFEVEESFEYVAEAISV